MKKVLAVATCYNRKEKTLCAIQSLVSGNKDIEFSFIICDDNSSDGTYEELQKINNVIVTRGNGKLYWCGGMRKALNIALNDKNEYDYILLFNDDVAFFDGTISSMIAKNEHYVLVGPTCDDIGNLTYGGILKTSNFAPRYKTTMGENGVLKKCDAFNANCVLIPWDIFLKTGNFDPIYTHQFGDYDYGFTINRIGFDVYVYDDYIGACCKNSKSKTFNDTQLSIRKRLELKKNPKVGLPFNEYFHYLKKNYSVLSAILFSITPYIRIVIGK